MAPSRQTILFMPESAYGPTNNCIGIGDVLRRRGHRVVFAAERSWAGKLEPLGFVEDLVDLAPPPDDPGRRRRAGRRASSGRTSSATRRPEFRKPTIEQLATFMQPTWQALIDGARYCEPQLREIIDRQQPDVIVEDNVVGFPALVTAGSAVRPDRLVQPARDARARRPAALLRAAVGRSIRVGRLPRGVRPDPPADVGGVRRLGPRAGRAGPAGPRVHPHLGRPEPLRLPAGRRLRRAPAARRDVAAARLERPRRPTATSSCRRLITDRPAGCALIYLSLGSLGSADVDLMRRLVELSSPTRPTATSSRRGRSTPSTSSPATCGAPSSCPRRRSSRSSTSSSPTAATTRRPRRSTSASR